MIEIHTGDKFQHQVYGNVQVSGFITVSDGVEINEIQRDDETELDVVCSVQSDYVEFIDDEGRELREPLEKFYEHADI